MKKLSILFSLLLILVLQLAILTPTSNAQAKAQNKTNVATPQAQKNEGENEIEEGDVEDGEPALVDQKKIQGQAKKLERIKERINNPEIGNQLQQMVENQNQIQQRTDAALQKIEGRPAFIKFLIGPDYKNLGQLRKQIVQIRNQTKQLKQIQEKMDESQQEDVQGIIDGLEENANQLEQDLEEKLSGFSLFGWLAKMFTNF